MVAKKQLYTLLLFALIALKVSALPIYSHYSDDTHVDDCELCEHAIANQVVEFFTPDQIVHPEADEVPVFSKQVATYEGIQLKSHFDDARFGRPPPTLI